VAEHSVKAAGPRAAAVVAVASDAVVAAAAAGFAVLAAAAPAVAVELTAGPAVVEALAVPGAPAFFSPCPDPFAAAPAQSQNCPRAGTRKPTRLRLIGVLLQPGSALSRGTPWNSDLRL
jgi:hypothetical protein